jgi:hypothetical protein
MTWSSAEGFTSLSWAQRPVTQLQYVINGMPIQIGLALLVNVFQPEHFGIQNEKFFGNMLIVREKMPHIFC